MLPSVSWQTYGAACRFRQSRSGALAVQYMENARHAHGVSLGPFWGTFDKKAAPRSDLRESKLVAVHVVSEVPRQGLEPRTY